MPVDDKESPVPGQAFARLPSTLRESGHLLSSCPGIFSSRYKTVKGKGIIIFIWIPTPTQT